MIDHSNLADYADPVIYDLEALLHYNGFTVEACYGDWERGRLTEKSGTMAYVCYKGV